MSVRDFRGLGVCEGIAFGRVHLVDRRRVTVPHYHIPEAQRSIEVGRFEDAVRISETQLEELQERAGQNGL